MLLPGLYEAFLDNRIIGFLAEKTRNWRLTLDMRARLPFMILVGSLDLEPERRDSDERIGMICAHHDNDNNRWPNYSGNAERSLSSPWTHVKNLLHPLRSYYDMATGTPRQFPIHKCTVPNFWLYGPQLHGAAHTAERTRFERDWQDENSTSNNSCMPIFIWSYVGASVIFFPGTFIFTIVLILSKLGDEDTSLALAFGIWYMIIPHISIVSGLLVAGNNPNTLECVVALEFGDVEEAESFEKKHFSTTLFKLAYESCYKPQ